MTLTENPPLPPEQLRRIVGKHFRQRQLRGLSLSKVYFIDCRFSDLTFSHGDLRDCHFENCQFNRITLQQGLVENCTLRSCVLHDIDADRVSVYQLDCLENDWVNCVLKQCKIERWLLSGSQIRQALWQDIQLAYWTAVNTPIADLVMTGGSLQDANWHACRLQNTDWQQVAITRQVMGSCEMHDCRYQKIVSNTLVWSRCQFELTVLSHLPLANASFHHCVLKNCRLDHSDLSSALFGEATLENCDLTHAQLSGAQFCDAQLIGCHLATANLQQASFLGARLEWCDLTEANLNKADLRSCNLRTSSLQASTLHQARLHGAQLQPLDITLAMPDPLLNQIDSWYHRHQPGPKNQPTSFPIPSGASRYV